jgi:energy-coupling factor transport system ATP-binding protein
VLVLDEPTFGQDDADIVDLLDRLGALRDGGTAICVVTHDDRFVSAIADRTLALTRRR